MTVTPLFKPATRVGRWPRVAIVGSYGTGKTVTALRLATGFGGRIGVVDTYRGAADQYANRFKFGMVTLDRFDPTVLARYTYEAADQGIDTLVIDGSSPFWSGPGGIMEQVDLLHKKNGPRADKSLAWSEVTPSHRDMLAAFADFPGALIVTVMEKTDPAGTTKADQRDGFEVEFGLVLRLHAEGGQAAQVTKTTMPDLARTLHEPGEDLAAEVAKLLTDGATTEPLHQVQVRDWAGDPTRTLDELRERTEAIDAVGRGGSKVLVDDKLMPIGELLRLRWRQRKAGGAMSAHESTLAAAGALGGSHDATEPALDDAA